MWNQLYNKDTLLSITKTDKYEQSHSQIIRYILDPNEKHGLGTKPLELFLRLLVIKNLKNETLFKSSNELLSKSNKYNILVAVPEKTYKNSRYDIYIEFEVNNKNHASLLKIKFYLLKIRIKLKNIVNMQKIIKILYLFILATMTKANQLIL